MNARTIALIAAATLSSASAAQKPPAIRTLGPIVRVSTEPLASVAAAVPLSDGRVYANDIVGRRVILFDSTLATAQTVADSTPATSTAYGARPGRLIAYRADAALFIDPASSSMLVLSNAGKIGQVMASPRPNALFMIQNVFGTPGFDARGRLVFFAPLAPSPGQRAATTPGRNTSVSPDSAFVVRFDLATRALDTVAVVKTPKGKVTTVHDDDGRLTSLEVTPDLFPVVDDWAVLADGAIAVVRGRDYHVDWILPDGKEVSTPKMAFEWQHLDDDQKTVLIDSSLTAIKKQRDSMDAVFRASGPPPVGAGGEGGRGGGRSGGGGGGPPGPLPALLDGRPTLGDLPDYRPPFLRGSVRADADGNLWIRTTIVSKGQPVYDIVNRRGDVIDRVQLPPFRTIAGFGPGVVYMAVKDAAGVVHLERARVR